ncbi:zincin-like metallopeptidase domain-containing protein, partial [Pseudomonas aeruginosa]|nr:zincin-like metallopeptidase domain-containing protein [Pseudomonas aeruginosa]
MKKEYAEEVAARIIEQLEQGTAPWQKPWQPGELRLPYNPTTGKEYRGMNSLWLHMQGHSDPRWMTYNQAAAEGAQVRKGSKGTHIVYWKFSEERKATDEQGRPVIDPDTGKQKTVTVQLERPRSFMAVVFNGSQIDGLPPLEARPTGPEPERHARAEAILANSGADIRHEPGDRAFYRPSTDSITLPERNQFPTADNYYATALHELGHWTGHPSRLDRDLAHPFGSEGYAREELRAEIASLMLGERLEIGHDPGQHAAYVGSWVKALKEDPKEIFRAASDAERISAYVMDFEQ